MNLIETIAKEYNIPFISNDTQVWFFRTKGGQYYHDFKLNNYIALGWDKIPSELITSTTNHEYKRDEIKKLYPEEKRPGLILGQMEVFYNEMNSGDYIVIPSEGSKEISIGCIGDLITEVKHRGDIEEYDKCNYLHKRLVKWIKRVEMSRDIYLLKELRAQQTISNLSKSGGLIFRNLFQYYISDDGVHFTMQKLSSGDFQLIQSLELENSMMRFFELIAELYQKGEFINDIHKKTAVGSPGFLEIILPNAPISVISIVILINIIIGFNRDENGVSTGIIGIISELNNLINDHKNRKKIDAETNYIDAQTQKTLAETDLIRAKTRVIENESHNYREMQIEIVDGSKTNIDIEEENEQLSIPELSQVSEELGEIECTCDKIKETAENCGIEFEKSI